ncbi:C2 NT-type domain-containing protein [Heracleum sosnowskyi]|uniref:C2 NT-type domain-containing protein n=1 Tax=Heracleum sosnowskyi TaxID=360622 RepID=A0AAD8IFT0_9APIA|nr:C2 NT-type domain-containing protein [Heracleum sosnowskyi]
MVVKMIKWRPWPPLLSKKVEVKLVVKSLDGWCSAGARDAPANPDEDKENDNMVVEIRWKGPKIGLTSFRRTVKKNVTKQGLLRNGVVEWDEEFFSVCTLSGFKDNVFHPWEITFTVLNGLNLRLKNKVPTVGTASLNLAEFASKAEGKELDISVPLTVSGNAAEPRPSLFISLCILEPRAAQESAESVREPIVRSPSPLRSRETFSEKDEVSVLKAGLRKVRIFTEYVSTRKAKKACREEDGSEGKYSTRSEEGDYTYPFDSDSLEEFEEGELDEMKEDSTVRNSFNYGTLAYANCAGQTINSSTRSNCEDEGWIYYSNRKSDLACSNMRDYAASASETVVHNSKRSILPWRKRKLGFRSPKFKGEPLLKKDYGEEGGDDIDFDRRQFSSDESLSLGSKTDEDSSAHRSSVSEFGEDNFAIGSWEQKEITSRDGHMKLQAQVFFASIDQRSERAAGESACTTLVAVIANWFQNNQNLMLIKSQFDTLIREGSLEWRNLCENETYRERFPDKHFDLETVLQANNMSLIVVPGKSFIGFFHPDEMEEGKFDFLHGAMSFDSMWDEISRAGSECSVNGEPQIYIVSWNDHFFILKVEPEAYYIIDTLGERLYEGCEQAYILKFDRNATIYRLPADATLSLEEKPTGDKKIVVAELVNLKESSVDGVAAEPDVLVKSENEELVVCRGKESCKEYIKSFLAAIPIRELQADIKRGLMASTPLHHRLQIEIHYTQLQIPESQSLGIELAMTTTTTSSSPVSEVISSSTVFEVALEEVAVY